MSGRSFRFWPFSRSESHRKVRGRSSRFGWGFWVAVGWLVLVGAGAALANLLPLSDPTISLAAPPNLGPSLHHLLGTDKTGIDVLSQVVYGARVSLAVGFGSVAIGLAVGGTLGLIAGYFGGKIDYLLNSISLIFLSFPPIILAIGLITFLGHGLPIIVLALGIVAIPLVFRIVRASAQTFAQREFVVAARALGARSSRIIAREIFPNVAMTLFSFVFIAVGFAIIVEAALSFLGISVRPPTPTWGTSVVQAVDDLQANSTLWVWPSLALFFTVLSLNVAGDAIRKFFGVRESLL